jgi:hypothetical protein
VPAVEIFVMLKTFKVRPKGVKFNFPRISGHTERIEIKEENFIKEVCNGTRKEKEV